MGMAMRKGVLNYVSIIFGMVLYSVWCISQHDTQASMAHNLTWAKSKSSSLDSISVSLQYWGIFWGQSVT